MDNENALYFYPICRRASKLWVSQNRKQAEYMAYFQNTVQKNRTL